MIGLPLESTHGSSEIVFESCVTLTSPGRVVGLDGLEAVSTKVLSEYSDQPIEFLTRYFNRYYRPL